MPAEGRRSEGGMVCGGTEAGLSGPAAGRCDWASPMLARKISTSSILSPTAGSMASARRLSVNRLIPTAATRIQKI